MTSAVLDASAAVELVARTDLGVEIADLLAPNLVLWVPDGLFDVEIHAVLRRWELNAVLKRDEIAAARMRLAQLRLRRARVALLAERAWTLRPNITFSDACYVALAETLHGALVTSDWKLVDAPVLPVSTIHPHRP